MYDCVIALEKCQYLSWSRRPNITTGIDYGNGFEVITMEAKDACNSFSIAQGPRLLRIFFIHYTTLQRLHAKKLQLNITLLDKEKLGRASLTSTALNERAIQSNSGKK
uniref:Uncharacterized protein n=1 Tax=Glossina austeni TaxID=7395 RepID=A0A1A9V768_GLOAU